MAEAKSIQSVARAIAILRCFQGNREWGLTEISKLLGLHKSTTAGLVNTLKAEGFLEQNRQTGRLRLGLDLYAIAAGARLELEEICEPYLNRLLELTGETVNLAVRDDIQVVYVAKKESSHSMRISTRVGTRLPLHCTAIGKAILSAMEPEAVRALIARFDMEPFTPHTIVGEEAFLRDLELARREGVALDREEWKLGLICAAAPLCSAPGQPVGAVSVSGPSMRMDPATILLVSSQLRQAAADIQGELARLTTR